MAIDYQEVGQRMAMRRKQLVSRQEVAQQMKGLEKQQLTLAKSV